MTACVFTGPTLSPLDARGVLDAIYLPPVQQGDVYRAALRHRPRALGIIDGYFQQVPSVWHKEILWAMAQGIHVFGGGSMGAVRAAELSTFGMHGIGRVFTAYRDGTLPPYEAEAFEDDDEVAVMHGPSETGFGPLSEAMVNIRCTLTSASEAKVISPLTRDALARIGKSLFFPDRSYEQLLSRGAEAALPASELSALHAWLPSGRLDQKRDDALATLVAMREFLSGDPEPARVEYVFARSEMWERAAAFSLPVHSGPGAQALGGPWDALLEELRLDGSAYAEARRAGVLRMLALRECERQRLAPGEEARRGAAAALRDRFGMVGRDATERWLADRDLTSAAFARLVDDEARLRELDALAGPWVDAHLIDQLRATGDYARYAARARAKQRVLADTDVDRSHLDEWTKFQLTTWYFDQHLGTSVPDDVTAHAARMGFGDLDAFYRALLREYAYVKRGERPAPAPAAPAEAPPERGA